MRRCDVVSFMQEQRLHKGSHVQFFVNMFSVVSTLSCIASHAKNLHFGPVLAFQIAEVGSLVIAPIN
jgi:hypothetical protein